MAFIVEFAVGAVIGVVVEVVVIPVGVAISFTSTSNPKVLPSSSATC